jgi:DinB superfamily
MNPYASQLGNQDPMRVLGETPNRLQQIASSLKDRINNSPAAGKWSPREILVHLADTELTFGFRYRQALADDNHVIQPFDQEKWAKSYAAYTADQALSLFAAMRNWNLVLLRSLTPEQLARTVTHPERGTMVLMTIIETAAGHDLNHLKQLEAARQAAA